MDTIKAENVKVPNSVLVSGLTGDKLDNEVLEYLAMFGSIQRVINVTSAEAHFKNTAIVEFTSGEPVKFLCNDLPCKRMSSNPNVIHHIQLLSELYVGDKGSNLTHSYLAELWDIAKQSGTDFEKVLKDELARIEGSSKRHHATKSDVTVTSKKLTNDIAQAEPIHGSQITMESSDSAQYQEPDSLPFIVDIGKSPLHRKQAPSASPCLPLEQLTTPEVQKVVVEHVIKNSELSPHYYGHGKRRPFSGKIPCPHMESDYDTWRSNVEFHLTDATLSARHIVRKIVESLSPPATNVVKHLGPKATPRDYISLLDSAYGVVDDGMSFLQNS
ncbi:uncharacterized protein LOC112847669 [Tachysurus ichikawai]